MPILAVAALAASAVLVSASPTSAQETPEADDPFMWLEEVEGERALEWVASRNATTLETLGAHPEYEQLFVDALEILNSDERIAYPSIMGEHLYNFWTDEEHERGIWRRTSWESYLSGEPAWEVILDIDALAEREGERWAFGGAACLAPEYRRCMVSLSRGGADATEIREFDLESATFVQDGFFVPEAKNSVAWRSADELLISTDFGEGSLTTSGYPRVARLWRRGQPLASAETLFEGDPGDVGVWVGSIETAEARYPVVFHRPSFFEGKVHVLADDGALRALDVPVDADPMLVADQIVVYLRTPWEVGGATYPEGSVVAMPYDRFLEGEREFDIVVRPDERQTVRGVSDTRDYLLVSMLDNVRSELWRYHREDGEWVGEEIDAPEMGTIGVVATDVHTNRFFFTYSSYTQPNTLYLAEEDGTVREVRQLPDMYDAEGLVVEQHAATSADGTRVPFFIVHREGIPHDGTNPTLVYGYGGFEISETPSYSAIVGKSWLERGRRIRGGQHPGRR